MIENKKTDQLALMFRCFEWEDSNLGLIIQYLQEHIERVGSLILNDKTLTDDSIKFVSKLLHFKAEIDLLVRQSF